MRTCFCMDPLTADPRKNGDQITSTFLSLIYEGLTRLKTNGDIELALAESVELSKNQKVYTFHLRKTFWSDGQPLTAADFEYSWLKALDPKLRSPFLQLFYPILNAEGASKGLIPLNQVGIRAIDEQTLEIELEYPTPYFLSLLSSCNFFPIPKHIESKNPHWEQESIKQLVSSGPFKLARWKKGQEIQLVKNPLYWDSDRVSLPSIQISIIHNPYAILQLFNEDELDLVSSFLCSIPSEELAPYRTEGTLKLFPTGGTVFCSFNMHQYPFHNQNIRKAFSYAIDREYIVSKVTPCYERPAFRSLPQILSQSEEKILSYDVPLARKFLHQGLEELGIHPNDQNIGFRLFLNNLTLIFDASQQNWKLAQTLQNQWRKAFGFVIRLESYEYKSYIQKLHQKNYSMGIGYWLAQFPDALSIFERFKDKNLPKNFPGYENPKFSELLIQSSREIKEPKRKQTLIEAESIFMEDMPLAPIYHFNHAFLCKPHLTGVEVNAIGAFHFNQCLFSPLKHPQVEVS